MFHIISTLANRLSIIFRSDLKYIFRSSQTIFFKLFQNDFAVKTNRSRTFLQIDFKIILWKDFEKKFRL